MRMPEADIGVDVSSTSQTARYEVGRSQRGQVPLEAHSELPPVDGRADPVGLLVAQDQARIPDLVPVRHGRMNATAFTFYRGTAAVMASDLSKTPTTPLRVQLCGDAHLSNFGIFNGPDRRLIFDLNDFDETLPGPFEWDVKRLAASVTIAGRNNELSGKKIARATRASIEGYRETLAVAAELSPLDLYYFRLEIGPLVEDQEDKARKRSKRAIEKASRKTSLRAFDKLTEVVDGRRLIVDDPPLITRVADQFESDELVTFLGAYLSTLPPHRAALLSRYRPVDLAHKVVGVGSVGTRCLIMLLASGDGDPLFLQFKEATASVLEPYLGPSGLKQAGERVVRGQRLMQATGDVLLGWSRYGNDADGSKDFYFRQLWDGKASVDVDEMGPKRLRRYARYCGSVLAVAHARSGDAAAISGYLGTDETFDHAVTEFAEGYADITERDHSSHVAAINSGRLDAVYDL